MIKLLIVVDDFVAGGAFKVGERLAHGLAGTHRVLFSCNHSPINAAARRGLTEAGVEIVRLFAHAGEPRRAICDFDSAAALLARTAPDKILFIDSAPHSSIAAKDASRELGAPYVSVVNFVDKTTPAAFQRWSADVLRAANAAYANVFVSAAAKADYEASYPGVTAPLLVVTNGVPDAFFEQVTPQMRETLRRQLGIRDDEAMLLLPGRLEPRKGQHVALSAFAALASRDKGPSLRLVLAGHGTEEEKLKLIEQTRALGLSGRVQYLGPRDDLPFLLDACDIVLMPSYQEADALVSKEAMAKGRPVVASDLASVREQGHTDALLIPVPDDTPERSVAALAEVLDDLSRDPAKRAELGRSLREIAQNRFTMAQMIDAYIQIIEAMPRRGDAVRVQKPPVILGCWLQIAESRYASGFFKDGWSDVENDGIWSVGARSRILFTLDKSQNDLSFTLDCWPLTPGEFDVWVNGRKLKKWTFLNCERTQRTFRLSLPSPKRRFLISLCNPNPASPFALGLNDDRRTLGLYVHALRIDVGSDPQRWLAGALRRIAKLWRSVHAAE